MPLLPSPALPVAIPLLGGAILAALRKLLPRPVAETLALLVAGATLTVSTLLLLASTHAKSIYWMGNWFPRGSMVLGIGFVVDPIGCALAVLAALLTLLALLFSWRFVEDGAGHMQTLMLIFLAAMSGFTLTGDLFNMFVFFELMSIAAFALCGLKTAEPAPLQGSFNFAVTNTVGAFFVLTGIALLYSVTGALNMAQIGLQLGPRHDPLILFAFTLLTCGFLIKAAAFPFHLWLPDAHAVAPTPVCVLFSGLMVELGLYAVLRLRFVLFGETFAAHPFALRCILLTFATLTVVAGAFMCYSEHHLKRMLAFSTISHAGLMLATIAIGTPLATAAFFAYLLAHAFIKSALFFTSGILLHRLRSISERELFARGRKLPFTAVLWFLGGAGLASAPPFATMWAEAGASHAANLAGVHITEALFLIGGTLTGAAVFRIGMHTFFGWGTQPLTDQAANVGELPETHGDRSAHWFHFGPAALLLAGAVALTFLPQWKPILLEAAATLSQQSAYLHTVYTGQTVSIGQPGWHEALSGAASRGAIATVLALLIALSSVFRERLSRTLRLGAFLEHGFQPLRAMQSGHPGDYTFWITAGISLFGAAALALLRR